MDKKYELVKEDSIEFNGRTLFRIRALKDFQTIHGLTVKVGDLGGYVQNENNLSQEGNCWVGDDARVFDNACVSDNAYVFGNACVCDYAWVYGNARVYDYACVCGKARVCGKAWVFENAVIWC